MQKLGYKKLELARNPYSRVKLTNEERFWRKYQTEIYKESLNPISCVSSNKNVNQLLVFGHGRSITVVDTVKKQTVKEINSISDNLTAMCIRPDSTVMACGDESGRI
jgi:hypothetical protein